MKDDDLCSVFYVETRAFPIQIFAEEGLNVIVQRLIMQLVKPLISGGH